LAHFITRATILSESPRLALYRWAVWIGDKSKITDLVSVAQARTIILFPDPYGP